MRNSVLSYEKEYMRFFRFIFETVGLAIALSVSLFGAEEIVAVSIRYFQIEGESHYSLYLYSANGTLIRQLTAPTDAQDTRPIFSSDGKTIYFTRTRRGNEAFYAIHASGAEKHPRIMTSKETAAYKAVSASPSFGYGDEDPNETKAASPLHYPAPDGSVELVCEDFDPNEPGATENEDFYTTQARHTFLVDLLTHSKTPLSSFPGSEGVGDPLQLSDASHSIYLIFPPLRAVFFERHLNSTDGTSVFALDLEKRRLVRLSLNWASVYPLPSASAFYTATTERYQPLGDGRTVNCSYLERWNADFEKVRFSKPKVALCGGASVYRPGKPILSIQSVGSK